MNKPGRIAILLVAIAGALVGASLVPATSNAHFNTGYYSHENGGCASRVNPVGAVFYGNGGAGNAQTHTWHHAGWGGTIIEQGQYFATHGVCYFQNGANASANSWDDRYHMRMRQTYDGDVSLGTTTVGTPHWEYVACGGSAHAVPSDGFDRGRNQLANTVGAVHYSYYEYWGNTQGFTQCNGWVAASNGNVRFFFIP